MDIQIEKWRMGICKKTYTELTNIERDMFDVIVKEYNITTLISKYVVGDGYFCVNFFSDKYKQLVQSKDYDKSYLIKEVRKKKLKKLNI